MPRQLSMLWTPDKNLPEYNLPEGYSISKFQPGDENKYVELLNNGELGVWDVERLRNTVLNNKLSPEGIFFVRYEDELAACAAGFDRSDDQMKGELGWVMADKRHRGKNLGFSVCIEVLKYLGNKGYKSVRLYTDFWRRAAVKTYINMGFDPDIRGSDDKYLWEKLSDEMNFTYSTKYQSSEYVSGAETALHTLMGYKTTNPAILTSWCMKREFFNVLAKTDDIYVDPVETTILSYIRAGANICPQFIMPSKENEILAADPYTVNLKRNTAKSKVFNSAEEVKSYIDDLEPISKLKERFNIEEYADKYAEKLVRLMKKARNQMLFIDTFGQPDFMGGYTFFGYENYLTAIALYPDHIKKYYEYTGEEALLINRSIALAVKKYKLAPFVYGGQDICFNDGPIVSVDTLNELYFPYLKTAVEPLHNAGIKIIWHCDGDIRKIAEILLKDIGVCGFQGFQEETGCTLDFIANLKTREGKRPIIIGSVSVTTTLPYGNVDDVKKDVKRCFDIAGKERFILGSTSSIMSETPLANIFAMYDYGYEYGKQILSGKDFCHDRTLP